jgi:hypothetical protein
MFSFLTIMIIFCLYIYGSIIVHHVLVKYNCLWLWRIFVIVIIPISWLLELINWISEKLNPSFGQIFYYSKNENEIHITASLKSKDILSTQETPKARLDYLIKSVTEASDIIKNSVKIHTHGFMFENEYLNHDWIEASLQGDKFHSRRLHYLVFEMMHKPLCFIFTEKYYSRHRKKEDWLFILDIDKKISL